jgi:Pirin C-terminal cupin domain
VGGAPIDGERHIWWNFVSSSKARIEQAFRGLDKLKKSREYAKVDLVVIQHVDRDAEA